MIPYPSPRVSQLDAHILDNELFSLLKEQLNSISSLHQGRFTFQAKPELWALILELLVFRVTVGRKNSTYGSVLQNLRYTDTHGRSIGQGRKRLLLLAIFARYGYEKLSSYLYAHEFTGEGRFKSFIRTHKDAVLTRIEHMLKVLNMVNFTLFLVDGRYSSLIHRVLGITLTPMVTDLLRFNGNNVNYEFQNRQLVWNVMTEFLVFTLPLLQLGRLRKWVKNTLSREEPQSYTQYSNLRTSECAICHENKLQGASSTTAVTNPCVTNCGHIYCYVCISTRFNSIKNSGEQRCLRCNAKLAWFKEWEDVEEGAIIKRDDESEDEKEENSDEESDENSAQSESDNEELIDEGTYEYDEEDMDDMDEAVEL